MRFPDGACHLAAGLAVAGADRAHLQRRRLGGGARARPERAGPFAVAQRSAAPAQGCPTGISPLRGTPSDCVIMARAPAARRRQARPRPLRVNSGANVAEDVTYSGTVAGAIEGTLLGIQSIAAQPGLYLRGRRARRALGDGRGATRPASSASCSISASRRASSTTSISPTARPMRSPGSPSPARESWPTRLHIDERRDGRNLPYYWLIYRRPQTHGGPPAATSRRWRRA